MPASSPSCGFASRRRRRRGGGRGEEAASARIASDVLRTATLDCERPTSVFPRNQVTGRSVLVLDYFDFQVVATQHLKRLRRHGQLEPANSKSVPIGR